MSEDCEAALFRPAPFLVSSGSALQASTLPGLLGSLLLFHQIGAESDAAAERVGILPWSSVTAEAVEIPSPERAVSEFDDEKPDQAWEREWSQGTVRWRRRRSEALTSRRAALDETTRITLVPKEKKTFFSLPPGEGKKPKLLRGWRQIRG